jgi:hypothetical protein
MFIYFFRYTHLNILRTKIKSFINIISNNILKQGDLLKKLSQTATEYMVVLAIVIIISLIVAIILGQFPGLGSSAKVRGSSAFWNSADVGVMHFSISYDDGNDDVVMVVRNNHNFLIRVNEILINSYEMEGVTPFVLGTGVQETLRATGVGPFCARAGDAFSVSLTIKYTDDVTGESYTFSGGGNMLEGKCAN